MISRSDSDRGKKTDSNYQGHALSTSYLQMNERKNIPLHHSYSKLSFPQIPPNDIRCQSSQFQRPASCFSEIPPSHAIRTQASLQDLPISELKSNRISSMSPNLKLPPILPTEPSSHIRTPTMAPRTVFKMPESFDTNATEQQPAFLDLKTAYENMMVGYFTKPSLESESCLAPQVDSQTRRLETRQDEFNASHPMHISNETQHTPLSNTDFYIPQNYAATECDRFQNSERTSNQSGGNEMRRTQKLKRMTRVDSALLPNKHTSTDITSSGCTVLDACALNNYDGCSNNHVMSSSLTSGDVSKNKHCGTSLDRRLCDSANKTHKDCVYPQYSTNVFDVQTAGFVDAPEVLNDLSIYLTSQPNVANDTMKNIQSFSKAGIARTVPTNSVVNAQSPKNDDPNFGRFSVLPPVASSIGGNYGDGDSASLMSYSSVPGNAQSTSQMGMYHTSFSPFSANFLENIPSTFASSPRYSARSSYSSRSRNKRALSNSPLSAEGIDLNAIIRMSPTSLIAYINGSRSSSSCISSGSIGEKTGCYGHLSARNSSSSPNSGSASSGNRRSSSYTPQTGTPINNNNIVSDNSLSQTCSSNGYKTKNDFMNLDDNLFVIQAMQDLESGVDLSNPCLPFTSQMMPEFENLQVLPQDIATFRTEDYMPFIPPVLPAVYTNLQPQYEQNSTQTLKPPPTYDQHMARKAVLQKNSSSDSSQPSNSSSFESSEGDKTISAGSGTDTESNRMYACRWLDCTAVFHDQDDFVTHIEKSHIDQKKGDDFICFWKLCPRRLHPFNARYKLLVHMRIHSGDKPNKCTFSGCTKAFSRLENLKIHLRSHTGEKPYSCSHPGCTKTFSNSSDRTKHQKTHQDTKPYVCQVAACGKRYTDPSSLRKHVKKSHPEKKEPDRKKIRSRVEDLDPKDLSECLVIQAIKPISLCDASPPEPTDSGLGQSPRISHPGSSSDHYPGLVFSGEALSLSDTTQGSSHTSPSSHHSSPPVQVDRENLPAHNNNLRVPVLPPLVPSFPQMSSTFSNTMKSPDLRSLSASNRVINSSNSSYLMKSPGAASFGNIYASNTAESTSSLGLFSRCSNSSSYGKSIPRSVLRSQSRFEVDSS